MNLNGKDDKILNRLARARQKVITPKVFEVNYSVYRSKNMTDNAVFYFHGWGSSPNVFFAMKKKLIDKNTIVLFHYPVEIISADPQKLIKYFKDIRKLTDEAILQLESEDINTFTIIGSSLGSFISIYLANNLKKFEKLVLGVPGDSLSEIMFSSIAMENIRKKLEKKGINKTKLNLLWHDFNPKNNLDNLKGKKIFLYLSKNDLLVPYENQKNLLEEMDKRKYIYKLKTDKTYGHYITLFKSLLDSETIERFME